MRGIIVSSLIGLFSLSLLHRPTDAYTATGAGYTVIDSDEPAGPIYTWDDLSAATPVTYGLGAGSNDDAVSNAITIPFSFPYFGANYTSVYASSNGFLWLDVPATASTWSNDPIPTSTTTEDNIICPFWDDLRAGNATASVLDIRFGTFGTGAGQRLVVQWTGIGFFGDATADMTFQAALYSNGGIRFQYQTMTDGTTAGRAGGSEATIGIEDATGTTGLEYLFDGAPVGNDTNNGLAVGFLPTGATAPWPVPGGGTTTTPGTTTGAGGVFGGREGDNGDEDWWRDLCAASTGSRNGLLAMFLLLILLGATRLKR